MTAFRQGALSSGAGLQGSDIFFFLTQTYHRGRLGVDLTVNKAESTQASSGQVRAGLPAV